MPTGTIDDPLSLIEALTDTRILASHTVHLLDGEYIGSFVFENSGELASPITIRAENFEQATINGYFEIPGYGGYVAIKDIIFTDTSNTDRVSALNDPQPADISKTSPTIQCLGSVTDVINCHVTNGWSGIFSSVGNYGQVYGCLLYHNGFISPLNDFGHNIYPINGTGIQKRIVDNIMFDSYGYNIHCYSGNQSLDNFWIEGNILFNPSIYTPHNAKNIHVGGLLNTNNTNVINNYTYSGPNRLNYAGGLTNTNVLNNYFANPGGICLEVLPEFVSEMSGNTFIGSTDGFSSSQFPDNTYITTPSGIDTFIRQNEYRQTRLNVAIYNWDENNSIILDVSDYYNNGDNINAHNVQDYFNDIQNVIVASGQIELDMQAINRTVSKPVGQAVATNTVFPTFGCFVLEKI